jgi:hypothetical protein
MSIEESISATLNSEFQSLARSVSGQQFVKIYIHNQL